MGGDAATTASFARPHQFLTPAFTQNRSLTKKVVCLAAARPEKEGAESWSWCFK